MPSQTIDPADLKYEWLELEEPLVERGTLLSGEQWEKIYRFALRLEWESPRGPFAYMCRHEDRLSDDEVGVWLQIYAEDMARHYDQAIKEQA